MLLLQGFLCFHGQAVFWDKQGIALALEDSPPNPEAIAEPTDESPPRVLWFVAGEVRVMEGTIVILHLSPFLTLAGKVRRWSTTIPRPSSLTSRTSKI